MKAIFYLFWLQFCLAFCVQAQPTQSSRAELPIQNDYTKFEAWPQPDSTVFVLVKEAIFRRNLTPFLLIKYGPDLKPLWQQPLQTPRGCKFIMAAFEGKTSYLLFESPKNTELVLLRLNALSGEQTQTKHHLSESRTYMLTDLKALDDNLFLTGLQNDLLSVLHLNPAREELLKLPTIYDQSSALVGLQPDTLTRRMEFILAESNGLKARLQIKSLAPDGHLFSTSFLQSPGRNYLTGRLTPGDSARKLLAGTYSLRDLRYAQGFFTGPILPEGNQDLKFFDFTSFSHFFDYLSPGRQEKVRRKVDRFRLSRKTFFLQQRLLLHEMYPYQNGFILAGELYFPQYEGDGGGNRIFNGFQFSQAVVAAFDAQGNLRWENSYPLVNARQFELKQATAVGISGQKAVFCHLDDHQVRYKLISDGKASPNDLKTDILPTRPTEKALSTEPEGLAHWHGNNFIVYGVQTVRSSTGLRTVFFLNKLTF